MRPAAIITLVALLSACAPPWADVPAHAFGCEGESERPSLCEWAWSSDALVVARIEDAVATWSPMYPNSFGEELEPVPVEQCRATVPGLAIRLTVLEQLAGPVSVDGTLDVRLNTERQSFSPGLSGEAFEAEPVWTDGRTYFQRGCNVLVLLMRLPDGRFTLSPLMPQVLEGDALSVPDYLNGCTYVGPAFEGEGLAVNEVLARARACDDSDAAAAMRPLLTPDAEGEAPFIEAGTCFGP